MEPYAVKSYNAQFDQVTKCLLEMGARVREGVEIAGKALTTHDEALRTRAKANDKEINRLDEKIEQLTTEMLATQHPMASDLRYVISAIKIAVALERAGDSAKSITKRMVALPVAFPDTTLQAMQRLVAVDIDMLEGALAAVQGRDPELAVAVWRRDDEADQLCRDVFKIILDDMPKEPKAAPYLVDILFAAKHFERIADGATTIAKTVYYVETGIVPHKDILKGSGQ